MCDSNRSSFKWSVDVATAIYSSNPNADTKWDYLYPQICKYMSERGIQACLFEIVDENRRIVKAENVDITVLTIQDSISISFRLLSPIAEQVLDEVYNNKAIFGLPVSGVMKMDDYCSLVTITFMPRKTWQNLNAPEAREFERRFNFIDKLCGMIEK